MKKCIDLVGQKFNKLTVIKRVENKGEKVAWLCKCDCGKETIVTSTALKSGNTKSCGCLKKEKPSNLRHGKHGIRLYRIWELMKQRCYNNKSRIYRYYGGKGIKVCDQWLHNFQAFYDWAMLNGYADDLTLDRIDNDKGYSPDNCRWATSETQHNNTSRNVFVEYDGRVMTVSQLAHEVGMPVPTLWCRLYKQQIPLEKAIIKTKGL